MRWAIAPIVVALAAVVAVNVLLLAYGGDRHDPVGRLSPVADLPAPPATTPKSRGSRTRTLTVTTVTTRAVLPPVTATDRSPQPHGPDD